MAAGSTIGDDASTCRKAPTLRWVGVFSFSAVQCSYMAQKTVKTLAEFEEEAARFIGALAPSEHGATLVTLSGELGAGKTAFTKAAARALGVEGAVTSPTFVLEKIYALPPAVGRAPVFKRLIHIDAYRLSSGRELAPLGFDELMRDSGNLVLLEWPEKVADALSPPAARVSIVADTDEGSVERRDGSRDISYA